MVVLGAISGCASPPSVVPLLETTRAALKQQVEHLETGIERDKTILHQRQQALERAFAADLAERDELTRQWVKEAAKGYVAGREAILKQHLKRRQQHRQRVRNLRAADEAQQRAVELLQRQDALIEQTLGGDLWQARELLGRAE